MFTVSKTDVFTGWLEGLRDQMARHRIEICMDRIEEGNLGDHHTVGGDKSGQRADIETAKRIAKEV